MVVLLKSQQHQLVNVCNRAFVTMAYHWWLYQSIQIHLKRPHTRARDMLGYHQYLYRTLPILFPPKGYHFWRDFLCGAAWETEWVFDAIVALGSMHRAIMLLSQQGGNARDQGLDTKIIAIQTYVRALGGVSDHLTHTQNPAPLAVGVLVLMAYIEVCRPAS
jgi:hypothetical protein